MHRTITYILGEEEISINVKRMSVRDTIALTEFQESLEEKTPMTEIYEYIFGAGKLASCEGDWMDLPAEVCWSVYLDLLGKERLEKK